MAKNTDEKQDIQEAIKAFCSKSLSEAGINLFAPSDMTKACKTEYSAVPW